MIFAVIDTNVVVSSLLTKRSDAATARVMQAIADEKITPLYNDEILAEYREVLARPKFDFDAGRVAHTIEMIIETGLDLNGKEWPESMPDESDRVFFEVALAGQSGDAKLVTGNKRHYPQVDFVVTPAQILTLLA